MTLLMNNLNKEKTERITLTYAHLPADVQFGGFAPALALFAPDINVARKLGCKHSLFVMGKFKKVQTIRAEIYRTRLNQTECILLLGYPKNTYLLFANFLGLFALPKKDLLYSLDKEIQ